MNLIDAIRSGDPFRRKDWEFYETMDERSCFTREEILATDWEIKERTVTITRSQFNAAWEEWGDTWSNAESHRDALAKELGL